MFSGVVSGSNIVMSLKNSGILEPPNDAGAPVASSWFILWSLISCVILFRTSTGCSYFYGAAIRPYS